MLIQLIYASTAVSEPSDEDLAAILRKSVAHNQAAGITGMLLYHRSRFLQALEGREVAVEETYRRITLDKRHRDLEIIERAPILRRSFGDWSMGFKRLETARLSQLPGVNETMLRGFEHGDLVRDPNFAKSILEKFVRSSQADES